MNKFKPNKWIFLLVIVGAAVLVAQNGPFMMQSPPLSEQLNRQLQHRQCTFRYAIDQCERRGFSPMESLVISWDECDLWAVKCLAELPADDSVPLLLQLLKTKTDVETCDGGLPIRSLAVTALGNLADPSALAPLQAHLASNPMARLSSSASGCQARPEDPAVISAAIEKIHKANQEN